MYYDTKIEKRQTEKHLKRRGLDKSGIDLKKIGIIPLVMGHNIDTDLYTVTDSGGQEIKDGSAYVVYEKENRTSNEEAGFNVRNSLKEKVHSRRDLILASGLDFSFDGETHVLQTRNAVELVNWTSVFIKIQALPADTLIKVRTEADKSLFIPAGSMKTLLDHLITYRTDVMDVSWLIKDSIDLATTDSEAFEVYESGIDSTWPDDSPIQL